MADSLIQTLWRALSFGDDGAAPPLPPIELVGQQGGLPSIYRVDELATSSVALATAAIAELIAARTNQPLPTVRIDRQHVAAAFRSERYLEAIGWALPPVWDPIAGDYRAADGWIRIHTNYASHRAAALRALGEPQPSREAVAQAVATRSAEKLEAAIVEQGGAAAKLRTAAEWAAHPQGQAVAAEPLFSTEAAEVSFDLQAAQASMQRISAAGAPTGYDADHRGGFVGLEGIRVLDLTRVIAGPVCTRVLAAYGADVLRIDPPGFSEVPTLLGDVTGGKRCASLDLRAQSGRAAFEQLIAGADLLVCGYRSDALARLGLGVGRLREVQPALAILQLDAYGWTGPWRARRGFDSLVQMSSGIAASLAGTNPGEVPGVLPAQALDHGAGYLLAAAAARALTRQIKERRASRTRLSLARIAALLTGLGSDGDPKAPALSSGDPYRERVESALGPLWRVRCPGSIGDLHPHWKRPPGPLGVEAPAWT